MPDGTFVISMSARMTAVSSAPGRWRGRLRLRITGLRVASQSAASATIAGARGPGDVGRALGVALLLEGTVQRAGPRVRVTMRLVSVAEDSTLWADRFEGAASDIFAVQDSLVRAAVTAVSARTQ